MCVDETMTASVAWWRPPRRVTIVVDNLSWILPYAEELRRGLTNAGERARLVRDHDSIGDGDVAFYLGCVKVTPPAVLARHRRNLVVHASDLPRGRGFSPLSWLVIAGESRIPVCLLEAVDQVDAGPIVYKDYVPLAGHELIGELRDIIGRKTVELCGRFLAEPQPLPGVAQTGEPSQYPRRRPQDSRLDPFKTIAEQFDLLRIVDNEQYPAHFDLRGHRYRIRIEKMENDNP